MNRAERRMLRIITRRGGGRRFTVLPSAETGLQNYGRLAKSDPALLTDAERATLGEVLGSVTLTPEIWSARMDLVGPVVEAMIRARLSTPSRVTNGE